MPALLQAFELQGRAHRAGFKWKTLDGLLKKLDEELQELKQAAKSGRKKAFEEELGDLLFMITNFARWRKLNAEEALLSANQKFRKRFAKLQSILAKEKRKLSDCSEEELERLWRKTKKSHAT